MPAPAQKLPRLPALNNVRKMRGIHEESNWVVRGKMLAGAYPGTGKNKVEIRNTLVKILTAGVNTFVCLQPTQEMKDRAHVYFDIAEKLVVENNRNKKSGGKVYGGGFPESITFVHMPFKDGSCVKQNQLLPMVEKLVDIYQTEKSLMYVHCWAGRGRTGIVCGCFLGYLYGLSGKQALKRIQLYYDTRAYHSLRSPETAAQRKQVVSFLSRQRQTSSSTVTGKDASQTPGPRSFSSEAAARPAVAAVGVQSTANANESTRARANPPLTHGVDSADVLASAQQLAQRERVKTERLAKYSLYSSLPTGHGKNNSSSSSSGMSQESHGNSNANDGDSSGSSRTYGPSTESHTGPHSSSSRDDRVGNNSKSNSNSGHNSDRNSHSNITNACESESKNGNNSNSSSHRYSNSSRSSTTRQGSDRATQINDNGPGSFGPQAGIWARPTAATASAVAVATTATAMASVNTSLSSPSLPPPQVHSRGVVSPTLSGSSSDRAEHQFGQKKIHLDNGPMLHGNRKQSPIAPRDETSAMFNHTNSFSTHYDASGITVDAIALRNTNVLTAKTSSHQRLRPHPPPSSSFFHHTLAANAVCTPSVSPSSVSPSVLGKATASCSPSSSSRACKDPAATSQHSSSLMPDQAVALLSAPRVALGGDHNRTSNSNTNTNTNTNSNTNSNSNSNSSSSSNNNNRSACVPSGVGHSYKYRPHTHRPGHAHSHTSSHLHSHPVHNPQYENQAQHPYHHTPNHYRHSHLRSATGDNHSGHNQTNNRTYPSNHTIYTSHSASSASPYASGSVTARAQAHAGTSVSSSLLPSTAAPSSSLSPHPAADTSGRASTDTVASPSYTGVAAAPRIDVGSLRLALHSIQAPAPSHPRTHKLFKSKTARTHSRKPSRSSRSRASQEPFASASTLSTNAAFASNPRSQRGSSKASTARARSQPRGGTQQSPVLMANPGSASPAARARPSQHARSRSQSESLPEPDPHSHPHSRQLPLAPALSLPSSLLMSSPLSSPSSSSFGEKGGRKKKNKMRNKMMGKSRESRGGHGSGRHIKMKEYSFGALSLPSPLSSSASPFSPMFSSPWLVTQTCTNANFNSHTNAKAKTCAPTSSSSLTSTFSPSPSSLLSSTSGSLPGSSYFPPQKPQRHQQHSYPWYTHQQQQQRYSFH